jgi:hypothetical protein
MRLGINFKVFEREINILQLRLIGMRKRNSCFISSMRLGIILIKRQSNR